MSSENTENPPPGAVEILLAQKAQRALDMRLGGKTYREIADELGYKNPGGVYEIVRKAIAKITRDSAEDLRALETQRLDKLLGAVWPIAMTGDVAAVDRVLRIQERRANV